MQATDKGVLTMKASIITCSVLAATLGFSGLASAQDWNGRRGDHDQGNRQEQRQGQRFEQRQEQRRDWRQDQRAQQYQVQPSAGYRQPNYAYSRPNYAYSQPGYAYNAPRYYGNDHARFQRGGYLPYEYRQRSYYVNDWNAYSGLYAPPYGYQWVQVGSDFALVALATGLIANLLTQ
jgi:Ni/Co efflux regulator RcnB